jgi:hypothetical protein
VAAKTKEINQILEFFMKIPGIVLNYYQPTLSTVTHLEPKGVCDSTTFLNSGEYIIDIRSGEIERDIDDVTPKEERQRHQVTIWHHNEFVISIRFNYRTTVLHVANEWVVLVLFAWNDIKFNVEFVATYFLNLHTKKIVKYDEEFSTIMNWENHDKFVYCDTRGICNIMLLTIGENSVEHEVLLPKDLAIKPYHYTIHGSMLLILEHIDIGSRLIHYDLLQRRIMNEYVSHCRIRSMDIVENMIYLRLSHGNDEPPQIAILDHELNLTLMDQIVSFDKNPLKSRITEETYVVGNTFIWKGLEEEIYVIDRNYNRFQRTSLLHPKPNENPIYRMKMILYERGAHVFSTLIEGNAKTPPSLEITPYDMYLEGICIRFTFQIQGFPRMRSIYQDVIFRFE